MTDVEKREERIWHILPVAALILWGALCLTNQLWYDEAFSAGLVAQPWLKMVRITASDAHSPFYYALLKLWYLLLGGGTNYRSLKLFSLLFMAGYLLLGKYYVGKLFGKRISIWFMLSSLLMPIMSVQAGNVRMYAMALFFMTLTGLSAYDLFLHDSRLKWVIFCLASVCTVYCHTFAMIQTVWIYLIFLIALLRTGQYRKLKGFFASGFAVAAVFSPWLYVTYRQMRLRMYNESGYVPNYAKISAFTDYCKEWFSALETPIGIVMFLGMGVAVVLGYLAVDRMREKGNLAPALGMATWGLTVLTGALVSAYINECFMGRYVFPGFGFVMLFYATGLEQIRSVRLRSGIIGVMCLCLALQYASELRLEYDGGLERYERFVEENVGERDVFVAPAVHALALSIYHPELQYRMDGYADKKFPFPNLDSCYDLEQLRECGGSVWYIASPGSVPEYVEEGWERVSDLHYMYYDFIFYRMIP